MQNKLIYIIRFTLLTLILGLVQEGYGQRVYADKEQNDATFLLASVTNSNRSVDLPDTTNYSTLNVTLGALGLIYARQNLQFVDNPKPNKHSPVIVKIGSNKSLLTLLGGFALQRTNGGFNSTILPSYSDTQLLNLLNLFGGGQIGTFIFPPNGNDFDGVRFETNSLLNLALTANNYYAFYIIPPTISTSSLTLCQGSTGTITISNFQSGYTYRLYDSQIGGTQKGIDITTNAITIPPTLDAATYYLEAREGNTYPSARTAITIARTSLPTTPIVSSSSTCTGVSIPLTVTNSEAGTTYRWYNSATSTTPIYSGTTFNVTNPTSTTLLYIDAINSSGCVSSARAEVQVTIKPKPPAPNVQIHPNSQY